MFFWNSLFWWSNGCWQFDFWFSAFLKSSLNIWRFTVHVLLKAGLENFENYFDSVWDKCNCAVVWAFFGTAFLWNWNENWPFAVLWPLLSFPNLLAYWVQLSVLCLIACLLVCKVCMRALRHRRAQRSPRVLPPGRWHPVSEPVSFLASQMLTAWRLSSCND